MSLEIQVLFASVAIPALTILTRTALAAIHHKEVSS